MLLETVSSNIVPHEDFYKSCPILTQVYFVF